MSTFDIKKFLINEEMTRVSRDRKRLLKEQSFGTPGYGRDLHWIPIRKGGKQNLDEVAPEGWTEDEWEEYRSRKEAEKIFKQGGAGDRRGAINRSAMGNQQGRRRGLKGSTQAPTWLVSEEERNTWVDSASYDEMVDWIVEYLGDIALSLGYDWDPSRDLRFESDNGWWFEAEEGPTEDSPFTDIWLPEDESDPESDATLLRYYENDVEALRTLIKNVDWDTLTVSDEVPKEYPKISE